MDKQTLMQQEAWLLRDKYGGVRTKEYEIDVHRLHIGEPLAYIIGWVPFSGAKIWLDSYPLIPRPETEFWTGKAIEEMGRAATSSPRVLDLCAGSGCIGIAVLTAVPDASVDFVEIDERHHDTIRKNIRENGIDEDRTRILGGSLFENVDETYDFILSNPPYIDASLKRVDENVVEHEPEQALYGGTGGTELISAIIASGPRYLSEHGSLYIEHEPDQADQIRNFALLHDLRADVRRDQFNVVRYSVLSKN